MSQFAWPALLALLAGVVNLVFFGYVLRFADKPGGRSFLVVIAGQVLVCCSQAVAMLVFDQVTREVLESLFWVGAAVVVVGYVAFAFEYTGRGHALRRPWFALLVVDAVAFSAVVVTNPLHQLAWRSFTVVPTEGVAAADYAVGLPVYLQFVLLAAVLTVSIFLLIDTVLSYGPLYRTQAIAIALTPLPPLVAVGLWLLELGPYPELNFVAVAFIPHVALDAYALFRSEMFALNPATRRTGERAAIDDLGSPVLVVDETNRIVTLNPAAESLLGADKRAALTDPLDDYLAVDATTERTGERRVSTYADGERLTFTVVVTPLTGPGDTTLGYTVVLQDVTDELARKQRLAVLNRVLRHNLRNDLTVVQGYLDEVRSRTDDPELERMLGTAADETASLLALGEKARDIERTMERDVRVEPVAVRELLDEVLASADAADVALAVPDDLRLETDPVLLRTVLSNLLENALEHGTGEPSVAVALAESESDRGRDAVFTVSDDGPGIPDHELEALHREEESALDHGSGLGLWLVTWSVDALGGELSFETGEDGTTARVRLPGVLDGDGDDDGEK
ncbi:histidine kinase N-terminal 7TM domain-containing protein [Haloarchaeobius iranensis]|uniref:histidine kinase n=1 Tax=Haloarchaeobius iranensis TaxID=996166 RepID=A0A1G9Y3U0_9EURY|nr:histidine kinase N-terminal 7TM domain-containing protein [Haloarchaeobius iranensis]SDN03105.1 PAS fold [Haloarchaeobius iranensis]